MTRKFALGIVLGCVMAASAFATPLRIASTANSLISFDGNGNFGFSPSPAHVLMGFGLMGLAFLHHRRQVAR